MKNRALWILVALFALIIVVQIYDSVSSQSPQEIAQQVHDNDIAFQKRCLENPEMEGCEKITIEAPIKGEMGHATDDHGAMVTNEESFVVNMIPHHQEAVDTARLVLARGENEEVKKLAQDIITSQEKEVAMMNNWVKSGNYSNAPSAYQNMMGDGTKLSGKALDTWFLRGMIMHHEGAVQMAESLLKVDARKEVADFAREVIRVQGSEILQMKLILGDTEMMRGDTH